MREGKTQVGHYAAVYDAVLRHIDRFSTEFDCDIFTNSVTEEFLDDFIVYLESRGLRHNTIAGYVQKIQSLVRKASQYNYAVDATYDGTDLREEPVNAVFLSMNEIARIYYYKFNMNQMNIELSKMQLIHLRNICKKDGVVIVNPLMI